MSRNFVPTRLHHGFFIWGNNCKNSFMTCDGHTYTNAPINPFIYVFMHEPMLTMYLCIYVFICLCSQLTTYLCIFEYIFLCIHVSCTYMYVCIYIFNIHLFMYPCFHVSTFVCIHVSLYLYVSLYSCIFVSMCPFIHVLGIWTPRWTSARRLEGWIILRRYFKAQS